MARDASGRLKDSIPMVGARQGVGTLVEREGRIEDKQPVTEVSLQAVNRAFSTWIRKEDELGTLLQAFLAACEILPAGWFFVCP